MPVYQTASDSVKRESLPKLRQVVAEFVAYVRENEAGTLCYSSWLDAAAPIRFVHFIIFADEGAHRVHGTSQAVKRFNDILLPELQGQVEFRGFTQVASTEPR
jgi:quinol monooxygenase YgiN